MAEERLATFAAGLTLDDIPVPVRTRADSQTVTVRTGIYDPSGNLVTTSTSGNTGVSANGKSTVTTLVSAISSRIRGDNLYSRTG